MRPYGQEKMITAPYKRDNHVHIKGRKIENWWEEICDPIPRKTIKHNVKRQIETEMDT